MPLLVFGTSPTQIPFGNGLLCLGSPILRLGVKQVGATGVAVWAQGFTAKTSFAAGETQFFQVWFRDPGGLCGAGTNFSNGVEVTFVP